MISRDRVNLVLVAIGILSLFFASIFFPLIRHTAYALLIAGLAGIVLLVASGIILLILFNRALAGPRGLSGTRCRKCRSRAMQEIDREFLHGNVKFQFDHYRVQYRCSSCGQQEEQEEHVDQTQKRDRTRRNS